MNLCLGSPASIPSMYNVESDTCLVVASIDSAEGRIVPPPGGPSLRDSLSPVQEPTN